MDPSIMNTTDTQSHAPTPLSSSLRFAATLFVALGLTLGLSVTAPQTTLAQNTYTVDVTGDAGDNVPGDGTCATSGGSCTLRAAIEEANASSANDDIEFDIPQTGSFATISINNGELPTIAEPVTINGKTSPEYPSAVEGPAVEINGNSLGAMDDNGFTVAASNVTITALGINEFPDEGVDIFTGSTEVTVEDCFVGIAIDDGESDRGNLKNPDTVGDAGIYANGDDFRLVGNVISHNSGPGVYVSANSSDASYGLGDNLIGLDWNGDDAAGNDGAGVRLDDGSANVGLVALLAPVPNTIPNTISANAGPGVLVESDSDGSAIRFNMIGTDSTGTTSIGNANEGVRVLVNNTEINSNTISGNGGNGITIGDGGSNTSADGTTIENNTIGLNDSANSPLPNGDGTSTSGGIVCYESSGTGSGDETTVDGNTIGGNDGQGIWIMEDCFDWDILDNYVGVNSGFDSGLGNQYDGIQVKANPSGSGEETEVVENIIGNNDNDGIDIRGSYHDVANNFVGAAPDGSNIGNGTGTGNQGRGIVLDNGGSNLGSVFVGGSGPSIPGNGDAAGNATPNGNGNVIGHNRADGILLQGQASTVYIQQNYVGTNPSEDDLGNGSAGFDGIRIIGDGNASTDHVVGYDSGDSFSDPLPSNGGDGNVVAFNGGDGISVGADNSETNVQASVRGNSIFQNGGVTPQLALDLGNNGVTDNDNANDDDDDGPNNLQNSPIIGNVSYNNSNDEVTIEYRVQTTTSYATYPLQIDFYAADTEASAEGKTYLDTQEYKSADATTSKTNVIDLSNFSNVDSDDYFVATATDDDGNTSEFFGPPGQQLPVELASFEAAQSGESDVELRWTTASETNNAGFRVQHRASGEESWTRLGYVASKASGGTTTEAKTYRFDAEDLAVGTHEFRLKQMDLDGTAHLHDPVDVELQMQQALRLNAPAPNPVRTQAQLSFAVRDQTETTITMYNPLGQKVAVVYRGTPPAGEQQTAQVTTDDLASGVYFLRLQAGGTTKTQKMTVVR